MLKDVIAVEPLEARRLLLTFEGGEARIVDIAQLVPFTDIFEPLSDDMFFRQVAVAPDLGTIVWPNGADVCPEVLYEASQSSSAKITSTSTTFERIEQAEL